MVTHRRQLGVHHSEANGARVVKVGYAGIRCPADRLRGSWTEVLAT
jgi:hypothetical protein